jgi:hypothetical protein
MEPQPRADSRAGKRIYAKIQRRPISGLRGKLSLSLFACAFGDSFLIEKYYIITYIG